MARNRILFVFLAILFLAGCVSPTVSNPPTGTLVIDQDVEVSFVLPGGWVFTQEPPEAVITQMIDHLREEDAAAGHRVSDVQLAKIARQRLAINEGFIVKPKSGAYLMIDFRPLRQGEDVHGKKGLIASARGAELALRSESGVTGVSSRLRRFSVTGSLMAYRLDIDYFLHANPRRFVGVIGCTESHRFYFYYNDPLRDPLDYEQMEHVFRSLVIRSGAGD
jgi:hypothetical protein